MLLLGGIQLKYKWKPLVLALAIPLAVGGLSALLSMLNSCASGCSVVNIDNGFGAGYLASMINQMEGLKAD